MARKSRKSAAKDVTAIPNPSVKSVDKIYQCALYTRISVENEKKREADTIGNQLQLLRDYVSEHHDLAVFDIYCDDDISGTDFVRPEFSRMMNDLRDGKIDCVIVKDLSRLGRNYLEAGEYIEMIFPFFQCRFIAVTDRFDTKFQQADISVQLKNLANEMYAKDISRKICSSMRTIQEQGKFAGSRAPYGYLNDPDDKHHLILDEETASVVKEMFEMVVNGNTLHGIATTLNARGVPCPGRLLYERGISKNEHFKNSNWYTQTIRRILTDPIYLGWMVSGRFRSTYHATGEKGSRPVSRDEWIITKGTHEPIVSESLFNRVQEYFERTKQNVPKTGAYNSKSKKSSIFKGHLRCGECGQAMFLRHKNNHQKEKTWWYYCALHENYNSSYCVKKAVKQKDVEEIALRLIKLQMQLFTDARAMILSLNQKEGSRTKYKIYQDQIRNVKKQIDRYMGLKASLYEDYANGTISQLDYIGMGQEYAQKADELCIFLRELEKEAEKYSLTYATGNWSKLIEQYRNAEALTEEMVDAFIDEMILYNNGHVEIKFNFKDELDEVIHLAASRSREGERYAI